VAREIDFEEKWAYMPHSDDSLAIYLDTRGKLATIW
jgi:hypothetical protein